MNFQSQKLHQIIIGLLLLIIVIGIIARFCYITENQFVYYDEGYYLNFNRKIATLLDRALPTMSWSDLGEAFKASWRVALSSNKALWYGLLDLRVYFLGVDAWYFSRILAAIFGSLTVGMVYLFAKRFYDSKWVGILSAAMLAIFPSHVYYSRLGMQETMSAFLFLAGLYFYLFDQSGNVLRNSPTGHPEAQRAEGSTKIFRYFRICLSAVLLACVFFTNYRLIIAPLLIGFSELFMALSQKEKFNIRKYIWHTVIFLAIVVFVGALDGGKNTYVTFGWMFHQKNLSSGHFDLLNFFSYPYYMFRLEGVLFTLSFFGNIHYFQKRQWEKAFPFSLICLIMLFFSFPQEKGARYLCFVMPLMVVAGASLIVYLFEHAHRKQFRIGLIAAVFLMFLSQGIKANAIVQFMTDYETAVDDILLKKKNSRILASQQNILNLYTYHPDQVSRLPQSLQELVALYAQGFHYIVIGPQAYISYTDDGKRFSTELNSHLQFILQSVPPTKVYRHFDKPLLERFVFEHSENLRRSHAFLKANHNGHLGALRVYDIKACIAVMSKVIQSRKENLNEETFFE